MPTGHCQWYSSMQAARWMWDTFKSSVFTSMFLLTSKFQCLAGISARKGEMLLPRERDVASQLLSSISDVSASVEGIGKPLPAASLFSGTCYLLFAWWYLC